jgi:hypothetical protein
MRDRPQFVPKSDLEIRDNHLVVLCEWEFMLTVKRSSRFPVETVFLRSFHRLDNPESPDAVYSVWFHESLSEWGNLPARVRDELVSSGCAWLMSHWWEHKLNVCPCIGAEKDKDNNFRHEFIATTLSLDPVLHYGCPAGHIRSWWTVPDRMPTMSVELK